MYVITPLNWVVAEVTTHSSLLVVAVFISIPNPDPHASPEFAAKFHPEAALVPPANPAWFEAQFVPEPEINATLFAAAVTRWMEQT